MSKNTKSSHPIIWWELRRIPFNIGIIIVTEISVQLICLFSKVGPTEEAIHPFTGLLLIVLFNIAYTLGWLSEIGRRRTNKRRFEVFRIMFYCAAGFLMISPMLNFFRFLGRLLFS